LMDVELRHPGEGSELTERAQRQPVAVDERIR